MNSDSSDIALFHYNTLKNMSKISTYVYVVADIACTLLS